MAHNRINYLDKFHKNGYRITRQRQAILDALCQAGGHATVAEVFQRAKELDPNLDKSTVYRALELFVELDLVIIGGNLNGERVYELIKEDPHHHLICKSCGTDIEIENQMVDDFYLQLQNTYGYQINMDHLIIYGHCAQCAD